MALATTSGFTPLAASKSRLVLAGLCVIDMLMTIGQILVTYHAAYVERLMVRA